VQGTAVLRRAQLLQVAVVLQKLLLLMMLKVVMVMVLQEVVVSADHLQRDGGVLDGAM
jgi:hypothetical protein